MILEVALFKISDGMAEEFEEGVRKALPLFSSAQGCIGLELQRSIEEPLTYKLLVRWEKLSDHTEGFRNSPAFQTWRSYVGHCFASAPAVDHNELICSVGKL